MKHHVTGQWRYVRAVVLAGVCAGCTSAEGPSRALGHAGDATLPAERPGVVCLPPRTSADVLAAGLYALCAEYRAGRIDAPRYSDALLGYADLVIEIAALDTLDGPIVDADRGREEIHDRLRANVTLRALCAAPSLAPFGRLAQCALLAG